MQDDVEPRVGCFGTFRRRRRQGRALFRTNNMLHDGDPVEGDRPHPSLVLNQRRVNAPPLIKPAYDLSATAMNDWVRLALKAVLYSRCVTASR